MVAGCALLAATVTVPPLVKRSGLAQQIPASNVVPGFAVSDPSLLRVAAVPRSTGPVPLTVVLPRKVTVIGLPLGENASLVAAPLIVVVMDRPTLRLPSTWPPVHKNLPVPANPPVPVKSAFPVSCTVVPLPMTTPAASVTASPMSNASVPPPWTAIPGLNVAGPAITSRVLPTPTDTTPPMLSPMKPRVAAPPAEAGIDRMPVLTNLFGLKQQALASTDEPGSSLNVPVFVIAAPPNSVSSRPAPDTSVSPSNLILANVIFLPAPLMVAGPSAVSGASSVFWPCETLHEKAPFTVTAPPDNDAFIIVRSCRLMPPGMPVTLGAVCDAVGAIVTLSPFCGTPPLQLLLSVQLCPSPPPVQLSLFEANAAAGASSPPASRPVAVTATNHGASRRLRSRRPQPPTGDLMSPPNQSGAFGRITSMRKLAITAPKGQEATSGLPDLFEDVDDCGCHQLRPFLVDCVPAAFANEVLAASGLGDLRLQVSPPAPDAFRQAFSRAQDDDRHTWQGRGRADMTDVRDRRGEEPVLVAEHLDLCSLAETGRIGVENQGLQLRVAGEAPGERPE